MPPPTGPSTPSSGGRRRSTRAARPCSPSAARLLSFTQSALGLTLIALLITYLPSIYAAFSKREAAVQKLDVTMAPLSPWSSDRSPAFRSPLLRGRAGRARR